MNCPKCNGSGWRVVDTRFKGNTVRRRRECRRCGGRINTVELVTTMHDTDVDVSDRFAYLETEVQRLRNLLKWMRERIGDVI